MLVRTQRYWFSTWPFSGSWRCGEIFPASRDERALRIDSWWWDRPVRERFFNWRNWWPGSLLFSRRPTLWLMTIVWSCILDRSWTKGPIAVFEKDGKIAGSSTFKATDADMKSAGNGVHQRIAIHAIWISRKPGTTIHFTGFLPERLSVSCGWISRYHATSPWDV